MRSCSCRPDLEAQGISNPSARRLAVSSALGSRLVNTLAGANYNAIIAEVRKCGDAYYDSAHDPRATNISDPPPFDPLADLYPAGRTVVGNRLVFDFPIAIDARWKTGYPKPVEFDPDVEKRVDRMWHKLGLPGY